MYLLSVIDRDMISCCFELHNTMPLLSMKVYPEIVCQSSAILPLTSTYPCNFSPPAKLPYVSHNSHVPFKYLKTLFMASQCSRPGWITKCETTETAKAISSQVVRARYISELMALQYSTFSIMANLLVDVGLWAANKAFWVSIGINMGFRSSKL